MTCHSQPDDCWVREHYPRIHRSAWLMTGDVSAAEDLAQEVFLVALDCWKGFEGRSASSTWLFGILMNLHLKRNRSLARLRQRVQQYAQSTENRSRGELDPATRLAVQQWRESVWSVVAGLPLEQQQAITLRFAEEMSYQQIATTLGCKLGTAKTRVHHGLKRLREKEEQLTLTAICPVGKTGLSGRSSQDRLLDRSLPLDYRPSL